MSDILAQIPLFSKLPEAERSELAALLKTKPFDANQPVVWLGEEGNDFYIVQSGKVSVSCPDESGKEVMLGMLGPGHFFGEISLLDGGPRTATVRAVTNSTMLILNREDFLHFLRRHPDAAIYMLTILGRRQRETTEKVRGIRNVNEAVAQQRTRWQTIAERVANASASQWFITTNLAVFGTWVIVNTWLWRSGKEPLDQPWSFSILGLFVTIEALLITLFVLISQGLQGERDRIRADLDYQVNLKAHQEVMQLHQKVDRLAALVSGQINGTNGAASATDAVGTGAADDAG